MSKINEGLTSAFRAFVGGFQKIIDKIDAFIDWIFELIPNLIKSLWIMFQDLFLWCFEQILSLVKTIIDGISGLDDLISKAVGIWSGVPSEVMSVLQSIGLGTALTIISSAILIRIALQLIPFTRLGS